MPSPSLLNAAVIGCGGHAQGHFRMIAGEPRLHLKAIAEIDPERLRRNNEEHGPEAAFVDYRQMLDECDLDVVHVVTMPGHLLPIVTDCLERGLHVSVEKSPGMNSAETEAMAAAARASSGVAMVSFNRRYFPEVLAVRRLVQERGGAVHCSGTYNKPVTPLGYGDMAATTPPALVCDAIHHVDLIRWLAGASPESAAVPAAVHASTNHGPRDGCDRHNAVVHFDTGAIGVMMSHYGVGFRIQRAEVHAEDFSAYLDMTRGPRIELYEAASGNGRARGAPMGELDLEAVGGPGFNETTHFVDCILGGGEPWSTLDDAVHTMRLCEAILGGHRGAL